MSEQAAPGRKGSDESVKDWAKRLAAEAPPLRPEQVAALKFELTEGLRVAQGKQGDTKDSGQPEDPDLNPQAD
jgi:hypothetical protein